MVKTPLTIARQEPSRTGLEFDRTKTRARQRSLVIKRTGIEGIARRGFVGKADGLALYRELGVMMST